MKFKKQSISILLFTLSLTTFAHPDYELNGRQSKIKFITHDELIKSLPAPPINVAFDVDDTAIFSSPGFYYGANNQDHPEGKNVYGSKPFSNMNFWNDMNTNFDRFSLPKRASRALIKAHKERKDQIYFITIRPSTKGEKLSSYLARTFELPDLKPVIFTTWKPKEPWLKDLEIKLFYGDADSDMLWAKNAKCRPIRFLRSQLSYDPSPVHLGAYEEEVLKDSDI